MFSIYVNAVGFMILDEEDRLVQIGIGAVFVAGLVITGYTGRLTQYVGNIIGAMILLFIGGKLAKIEKITFFKLFVTALGSTILIVAFGAVHTMGSIFAVILMIAIIKYIFTVSWKKAFITWILYFIVYFIFIVLAAIAAFLLYGWASSFQTEELLEGIEAEMIVVDDVILHEDGRVEVCLRNLSSFEVTIDTVYRNDTLLSISLDHTMPASSEECIFLEGPFAPNDTIKLITKEGTQIMFTVY
jgi:hypothetical protein